MTFGLNALHGRVRSKIDNITFVGPWNFWNAHHLIKYTKLKGYKIDSYELGTVKFAIFNS